MLGVRMGIGVEMDKERRNREGILEVNRYVWGESGRE